MNVFKKMWDSITAPFIALAVNIAESKEQGEWEDDTDR